MNFIVHQSIQIHLLKVGSIANSSVLQIGSTGSIQAKSDIYDTGGFTQLAEPVPYEDITQEATHTPLVPLIEPGE
ncbi:spore germination protein GerPB [Virgibacillus soli]|uniref:Spore germination protein GerPB n=1 Tax=Paracerasibacillus soli TaxID=480284 RepID=A0ABU5CNB2_9BACI|nr:spore germination protein GerPB [Virgibacillus soli]MDY0407856.1 spore germination protein GerPB [Virgibacillus soli]